MGLLAAIDKNSGKLRWKKKFPSYINENSYFNQLLFFFKGLLIIIAPMFFHFEETVAIFKLLLVDNETFYNFLNFIETNQILLSGIILSTLSSILLFVRNFELRK